jgi:hypothetical protein
MSVRVALQYYVHLINEGCELLAQIREGPISENKQNEIFSHRGKELLAYAVYTRAQRRLWKFLNDSESCPSPFMEDAIER